MDQSFQKLLHQFTGKSCWSTVAGEGTGSIISLGFGNKIPRNRILTNPHLSKEIRQNNPEFSLMIWSSWQLLKNCEIICNSNSPNDNDGVMVLGLKQLEGRIIQDVTAKEPSYNLLVVFDDGYKLKVECDACEIYGKEGENYTAFLPDTTCTVTALSTIEYE